MTASRKNSYLATLACEREYMMGSLLMSGQNTPKNCASCHCLTAVPPNRDSIVLCKDPKVLISERNKRHFLK